MTIQMVKELVLKSLLKLGLITELLAKNATTGDLVLAELELDSLSVIEICMHLENALGMPVEPVDFLQYPTLNALSEHFAKAGK